MRLLIATDGSPHANRAVEMGARLARELREAEIVLINVGHIPAVAFAAPLDMGYVDLTPLEAALEQDGKKFLEEATKAFAGLKAPVSGLYRRGEPAHEIVRAAGESKADLIILGARGLGQIGGLILGSVSERVLHGAHCPVLVVR